MLKIGIIGSGFGTIGLLPAFRSVKNCKVVATCTKRSHWRALLNRKDLDAVALAVPPNVQYRIAKAAIARGLHVFAEKPLAANIAQARELLALAKTKKITHGIDFIFPEIAEWKKVKEFLDGERFGELKHISANWDWLSGDIRFRRRTWRTNVKEGGGALSFYFSHGLYYLEHFAGQILDGKCLFTYSPLSLNGGEVGVDMLLKFKSGVTGNVHVSCNSSGRVTHKLIFECERGVIKLENKNAVVDNFEVRTYSQKSESKIKVKRDSGLRGEDERVKIVRTLAKRFVDACIRKEQMAPSFANGLRVQELIEKIRTKAMQ